jgi:hypothetical protein
MTNKRTAWVSAPTTERKVKMKIFRRRELRPSVLKTESTFTVDTSPVAEGGRFPVLDERAFLLVIGGGLSLADVRVFRVVDGIASKMAEDDGALPAVDDRVLEKGLLTGFVSATGDAS